MWQFAVLALASAAPAGQQDLTFDGESLVAWRALTYTWFTSFENCRFEQC